jgi:quinol monooxygenase YgiN
MIVVIALIHVKADKVDDFLEVFKDNMAMVRKERGCIEYFPAIDIQTNLPAQTLDKNVITIIEKWENPEALYDHLVSAHMLAYREKVKDIVVETSVKILKEA